ncbi:hypothetical protein ACFU99_25085 [Streptomyces sp. NPDC057654]|uniref:hypothetical protein n=1 Tax=Streptomyces sp. NPDC057654 TaxID=3346196 RepID=UPI003698795A
MNDDNARRTTFIFAPPVNDARAWNLRLDHLAECVERDFPGSYTRLEHGMGPRRNADALSFEVEIAEGVWLDGLATTPYEGMGTVMACLASPREAAVLAAWLRDSFIPSPELIEFSSEAAMEGGEEASWRLPVSGPVEEIAETLRQHLESAEAL